MAPRRKRNTSKSSSNDEPSPKYSRLLPDKSDEECPKCAICYNTYSALERSFLAPCKHEFCFSCIYQWLQAQQACPLCRAKPKKLSYHFNSAKKIVYTKLPPLLSVRSSDPLRLYVPMLQLFGKDDVLKSPELPEAFLSTVFERCSLPSDEHMFLMFYLIDSIELISVDKGPDAPSALASELAHDFLHSQLNLLDQNIVPSTFQLVDYLIRNLDNRSVVEECNLIFHCTIGQFMPYKFVRKLWELLMAYLRYVYSQQTSNQIHTPTFYFGLRHQRKDVDDEILFPVKNNSLFSDNTQNRLMQLMLSHFKAVISQNDEISKELVGFITSNVEINGPCVCAYCDPDTLLCLYNKYKIALLSRFLQIYSRELPSQNLFGIHTFRFPLGLPSCAVTFRLEETATVSPVKSLAEEISSVVNRLQHRQRLRSPQYQRNRARNFIRLVAAERQHGHEETISSPSSDPILPIDLVEKAEDSSDNSAVLRKTSNDEDLSFLSVKL